jgi:hypothetical protein
MSTGSLPSLLELEAQSKGMASRRERAVLVENHSASRSIASAFRKAQCVGRIVSASTAKITNQ